MSNLSPEQLIQLKKQFCTQVTDNMDLDTLLEIVTDNLIDAYHTFSEEEMKEEIVNYYCDDEQPYNDLVNTINPYTASNPEAVTDYGVGK